MIPNKMTPHSSFKIAAISDIHSNIFALEAVLEEIERYNVDYIVNLGDILYGPIAPKATYERLKDLQTQYRKKLVTIRGNQDRQIYEAFNDKDRKELNENPTMQFIIDELPVEAIHWMQDLPFDSFLKSNQLYTDVYLCHGSPTDDMIYLLEDVSEGMPKVRKDNDILSLLAGKKAKIIVCGHTHIPRTVTLSTGQIIINTGSVGYPAYEDELPVSHKMQNYTPHASYALIECIHTNGVDSLQVKHIKVPYDNKAAANLALKNGRPDWEYALLTGRVEG